MKKINTFLASILLFLSQAYGATTNWTDWTIPSSYPLDTTTGDYKFADGAIGTVAIPAGSNVGITLTGEVFSPSVDSFASWVNNENLATAYDIGTVTTPAGSDIIMQTGYTAQQYRAHTITFAAPVSGVVMGIWSLGGGQVSSLVFSEDFEIIDTEATGSLTKVVTAQGYKLVGAAAGNVAGGGGASGIIQFYGSNLTSITYNVTEPELYSGMTVGLTANTLSGTGAATIAVDTTAPTLVSSSPADDEINVAVGANITLTFSENIVDNGGNIVLKKLSDNSVVQTFSGFSISANTITLNPTSDLALDVEYYIEIGATALKDELGNFYAGISGATTLNFKTGADPTQKADVLGGIQATQDMALGFVNTSVRAVNTRLDWLRNHPDSNGRSVQGIKVTFADPLLDKLVNGNASGFKPITTADAAQWVQHAGANPDAIGSDAKNYLTYSLLAEAKEASGLNMNPTGAPVLGEWSLWSEGQVQLGKRKAATAQSKLDSQIYGVTIGMDRPSDNRVVGVAATFGSGDVDIGTVGSRIEADYVSLSGYSAFEPKGMPLMEVVVGVGNMRVKSKRVDGVQTLEGTRDNTAFFGAYKVHAKDFKRGDLTLKPYGALEAAYIKLKGYSEAGGSFALNYGVQGLHQTTLLVGLDINYEMAMAGGKLKPFTKVELGYDRRRTSAANLNYVGDLTMYRLNMSRESDRYMLIRVGADYDLKQDLSLTVAVEHTATAKSGYSNGLRAKLNWQY